MSRRTYALASNAVLTVLALVFAFFQYRSGNIPAALASVGAATALWKRSGRDPATPQ
jgi:hypothetical protein